ncbi:MAG: DUF1499 domain-containing protein [Pseudomonadota bacterium]
MGWSLLILAALVAIIAGYFMLVGPKNVWQQMYGSPDLGPFTLAELQRNSRPNDGLLCTPGACPEGIKSDGDLPAFDTAPAELLEELKTRVAETGEEFELVSDTPDDGTVRYVTWTPTMGFPDTNQFWAVEMPDGKTGLVAYARAQVGYSDAGNNLKRLKRWTALLSNED